MGTDCRTTQTVLFYHSVFIMVLAPTYLAGSTFAGAHPYAGYGGLYGAYGGYGSIYGGYPYAGYGYGGLYGRGLYGGWVCRTSIPFLVLLISHVSRSLRNTHTHTVLSVEESYQSTV